MDGLHDIEWALVHEQLKQARSDAGHARRTLDEGFGRVVLGNSFPDLPALYEKLESELELLAAIMRKSSKP